MRLCSSSMRVGQIRPLRPRPALAAGTPRRMLAHAMDDSVGTVRPGLSIHEAAVILGVSPNTVRRRVAAGSLRSERIARPQGEVIRVYLDQMPGEVPKQVPPNGVPRDVPTEVPPTSQAQVPDTTRAEAMAALISASIAPVLAPLVAELAASRQANERLAGQVARQAETIGELRAQNRTLLASTAPESLEPAPPRYLRAVGCPGAVAAGGGAGRGARHAGGAAGMAAMTRMGGEDMPTYEELRQQQLEHLAKLRPIQARRDRFISAQPLTGDTPEPLDHQAMQAAFDEMRAWQDEWLRLARAVSDARPR